MAGAYVKQGAVVSTPYNTIDLMRTMEEVLGLPPMNLNDALARPMADIFNTTPSPWSFTAAPSALLYNTQLLLPPKAAGLIVPKADAQREVLGEGDQGNGLHATQICVDPADFNRILWKGMMGNKPYPAAQAGTDLRENREENEERLARERRSLKQKAAQESKKGTN